MKTWKIGIYSFTNQQLLCSSWSSSFSLIEIFSEQSTPLALTIVLGAMGLLCVKEHVNLLPH